ncbi:MAG: hypothetical protein K9K82_09275 [Desulfobacteraceae bacterium]|nr:hypothetical protein [Desulfobacteraceae bacterium]
MKRKFHLVLHENDHRRLKALAGISGLNQGEVVNALLNQAEERGRQNQKLLLDAGLDSYANQPVASLGLMKNDTIMDLLNKAHTLRRPTESEWGPADGEA